MSAPDQSLGGAALPLRGEAPLTAGRSTSLLAALAIPVLLAGLYARVHFYGVAPLWLDETWTGAIAAKPDLPSAVEEIWQDVNAPAYYLIAFGWAKLFGLSNAALRFPALVFALAAPLLPLAARRDLRLDQRLLWCMLLAVSPAPVAAAQVARGYSLLLLLGMALTLVHLRLVARPSLKLSFLWAALGSLAVLTHYFASFLVLTQAVSLLAVHRVALLRLWPAALPFLPMAAWIAIHAPRIRDFARPDVAWYAPLGARDVLPVLDYATGGPSAMALAVIAGASTLLLVRRGEVAQDEESPEISAPVMVTVAASLAAALLVIGLGILRPSFALRYLTPCIPGIQLGFAVLIARLRWTGRPWPAAAAVMWAAGTLPVVLQLHPSSNPYEFERPSAWLQEQGVRDVAYLWDHPATPVMTTGQIKSVGGFFFRRAGVPVAIAPIVPGPRDDPNELLALAAKGPGSGLLWLYDTSIAQTAARRFPPTFRQDRAWICRDFGEKQIGVLACHRNGSS